MTLHGAYNSKHDPSNYSMNLNNDTQKLQISHKNLDLSNFNTSTIEAEVNCIAFDQDNFKGAFYAWAVRTYTSVFEGAKWIKLNNVSNDHGKSIYVNVNDFAVKTLLGANHKTSKELEADAFLKTIIGSRKQYEGVVYSEHKSNIDQFMKNVDSLNENILEASANPKTMTEEERKAVQDLIIKRTGERKNAVEALTNAINDKNLTRVDKIMLLRNFWKNHGNSKDMSSMITRNTKLNQSCMKNCGLLASNITDINNMEEATKTYNEQLKNPKERQFSDGFEFSKNPNPTIPPEDLKLGYSALRQVLANEAVWKPKNSS